MKRITEYIVCDKGDMYNTGKENGLSDDAAREFSYALYEIGIDLDVTEDGKTFIVGVEGVPLVTPIER